MRDGLILTAVTRLERGCQSGSSCFRLEIEIARWSGTLDLELMDYRKYSKVVK